MLILQKTVWKPVSMTGVGLHSGQRSTLTFNPAPLNTGLVLRVVRVLFGGRVVAQPGQAIGIVQMAQRVLGVVLEVFDGRVIRDGRGL